MRHILTFLIALAFASVSAQSTGDYHIFRKHAAVGDSGRYVTPVNNSLLGLNANGMPYFIAQSNFISTASIGGYGFVVGPSSATNNNVPQWDGTTGKLLKNGLGTSTGGNGSADGGKLVMFNAGGGLSSLVDGDVYTNAISAVLSNGSGGQVAIAGYAENGTGGTFSSESVGSPALECVSNDITYTGPIFHAHNLDGEGMEMANDGSLNWTSATGAAITRGNILPSKTGSALKVLRVNAGETDYELATPSGGTWGSITGTLSDQTDLLAALGTAQEPTAIIDVGSTNTAVDPGQNTMRFNSGTASSVTEISLSDVTSGSVDKGDLNSLFGGILQGRTVGTATTFEYRITAAVHTSFTRYTVTYLKGSIPADNTVVAVRYIPEPSTGGSGTVTSVAVSGSDGIEVDSGSPITTSGTIALGVNASTLKTHLSLNNVENTALSTWAGSANITTLGTVATGVWNGTDVAVADGGTGSSTASGARTNLGATTVGSNLFTLTNPSAISYARINADNTVTARTMAQSRTDLELHPVTITAITGGTQASTSTSLADVTGSTITFPDTGWYEFQYFIIHNSASTATGAFFAVNTGGTMAKDYLTYCTTYDVTSTDKDTYCSDGFNAVIASTSSRNASATNRDRMQGTIHVTTAGAMVLRFATEVNSSAITITDLSGWYRNL